MKTAFGFKPFDYLHYDSYLTIYCQYSEFILIIILILCQFAIHLYIIFQ